jgi:RNA polymerase sigma factor (sigma-70 family)
MSKRRVHPSQRIAFTAREEAFVSEALDTARRIFESRQLPYGLADEAVSRLSLRLVKTVKDVVDRYPSGAAYARAIRRSLLVDAIRSNDAQRGAGARRGRDVSSLDQTLDTRSSDVDPTSEIESRELLGAVLSTMTSDEQRDFCRTRLVGLNYSEVADINAESHTTVLRRVNRAQEKARSVVYRLATNDVGVSAA